MGFCVAKAKGFYEAEGLEVTILPGGPGVIPSQRLQRGEVDAVVERLILKSRLSSRQSYRILVAFSRLVYSDHNHAIMFELVNAV